MNLRRFCLAFALIIGFGGFVQAAPVSTAEPRSAGSLALVDYVKGKGHKGGKHGWNRGGGPRYGHYKHRRHHGWGRGRGRHYGWHRGRHRGWYKQRHGYGWRPARRVYFRF